MITISILISAACSLAVFAILFAATQPTPSIRAWRNPGETDSDMADRVLNASPFHQAELREGK